MKRKFKLFATVASLCLSVALMAFGVYAASTVTYTVTGTVSYTMSDVLVTLTTKTAYVTDDHAGHSDGAVTELTYANEQAAGSYTSYDGSELAKVPGATDAQTQPVTISFNTSTAWRITINVATINPTGVALSIEDDTFGLAGTENYAVVADEGNAAKLAAGVAEDANVDLIFYVYLKDATIAVSETTFDIQLNITQK